MTKKEILNKLNNLEEEITKLVEKRIYTSKKFNALLKEHKELTIEYNKLCNYYYHNELWIYDLVSAIEYDLKKSLTGNELVTKVAEELNKYDGIVVETEWEIEDDDYSF